MESEYYFWTLFFYLIFEFVHVLICICDQSLQSNYISCISNLESIETRIQGVAILFFIILIYFDNSAINVGNRKSYKSFLYYSKCQYLMIRFFDENFLVCTQVRSNLSEKKFKFIYYASLLSFRRCLLYNGYHCRKWRLWTEFKS